MKITKVTYSERTTQINDEINKMEQTRIISLANELKQKRLMKACKKKEGI